MVARQPLRMALPRQFEGIALSGVEIAEQTPDRPVDIVVHVHPFPVNQAVACVKPEHLADQELAAGREGERDMLSARCSGLTHATA